MAGYGRSGAMFGDAACQACQYHEQENEELRQRMARALVVIEALRKRLRQVEQGGAPPDDGAAYASIDPVGVGSGQADASVMRAAAEVMVQEATAGLRIERDTARSEVKAARTVVCELEVQIVEKDLLCNRYKDQLDAMKGQLRDVSSQPILNDKFDTSSSSLGGENALGSGAMNQSLVVNAEEHRREIASLWRRIQDGIVELRVARAEKEELRERLRCDSLGREAFELQRLRLQRLHREMAHAIEENRHKFDALESNWVRWVLKATEAVSIGMVYVRPLKRHAASAIRGIDAEGAAGQTLSALTGGAPRLVVANGKFKEGRIEIYARQRDDLPVVCFSTKKSRVEIIDGEFNFLVFGYFVPDDMTSLGTKGIHDDDDAEHDGSDDDENWLGAQAGAGRKGVHGHREARGGGAAGGGMGDWEDHDDDWGGFDFDSDLEDSVHDEHADDDEYDPDAHPGYEKRMPDFIIECDRLQANPEIQYRKWHYAFRSVGLLSGMYRSSAGQTDPVKPSELAAITARPETYR